MFVKSILQNSVSLHRQIFVGKERLVCFSVNFRRKVVDVTIDPFDHVKTKKEKKYLN